MVVQSQAELAGHLQCDSFLCAKRFYRAEPIYSSFEELQRHRYVREESNAIIKFEFISFCSPFRPANPPRSSPYFALACIFSLDRECADGNSRISSE